ncbi:hypothetical protein CBS147333_10055 [Penicillium roqueforti]|nr:hypothetical protein CBS147333_10055 [Penicillium roqueforti]KAI3188410.1 hypothetical protein CBS147311_10076 [Penicillium roqueforti]KAI3261094.1 hypothetical protein CBS147308_10052 [Penicillium roqueforti]KAI3277395.1 hypothetical protein DTO003C3_10094 [Penicillium roqueforti]
MGGIRKVSHTRRRQNFRSRLQRALSLSSSESEDTQIPSRPGTGDTTEGESSLQDEIDCCDDQENSNSADESEKKAPRERRIKSRRELDLEMPGQTELAADMNTVTLECVAELDIRMKSIESSSYDQSTCNGTVRNDLADIIARLAIMETEIKKVAKQAENKATEGQKIGRSLRRRQ